VPVPAKAPCAAPPPAAPKAGAWKVLISSLLYRRSDVLGRNLIIDLDIVSGRRLLERKIDGKVIVRAVVLVAMFVLGAGSSFISARDTGFTREIGI